MRLKFTRLAVIASCALGVSGVAAAPAFAVANPTVSAATKVTPESAVLHATVDPGTGGASYAIAYDTLSDYRSGGNNALYAGQGFFPAGSPVTVSAPVGCYPSSLCGVEGTPLEPNTTYVFYIQSQPGVTGKYYYTKPLYSTLGTFKTAKLGSVSLSSTKIKVVKGKAKAAIKCTGSETCKGKITYTAKLKKGKKAVTCGSAKFSLKAGKKATESIKLTGKCLSAAAKASKLTLAAKLSITSTVDQKTVNKNVKLTLS